MFKKEIKYLSYLKGGQFVIFLKKINIFNTPYSYLLKLSSGIILTILSHIINNKNIRLKYSCQRSFMDGMNIQLSKFETSK